MTAATTRAALPIPPRVSAGENAPTARVSWTRERVKRWGTRSMLSLADQGLTSIAGFGLNVFLARWLAAEAYGAFAVAFAGFLFVAGFHNVLLLEPLTVMGPAQHTERLATYFRKQLIIHVLLVGSLSAVVLPAGLLIWNAQPRGSLGGAIVGSAMALPFLLLLWVVRRMCYVLQRPSIAVLGSSFYACYVFAGLFLLYVANAVSPMSAFGVMGTGSLLAAWLLWHRLRVADLPRAIEVEPLSVRVVWRENWIYGRWLVASTALSSAANQTQMFLVAGVLGLGAAGILRAMQVPALVIMQILAATGLVILPAFSYDFGSGALERMRQKAKFVSLTLAALTVLVAGGLMPLAGKLERVFYGGKYADYAWLMPLLALVPAAIGASLGHSMALRASQKPRFDLVANAIAAPVGVISAFLFTREWGLAGAAGSMALSYAAYSVVTCWMFSAQAVLSRNRGA